LVIKGLTPLQSLIYPSYSKILPQDDPAIANSVKFEINRLLFAR